MRKGQFVILTILFLVMIGFGAAVCVIAGNAYAEYYDTKAQGNVTVDVKKRYITGSVGKIDLEDALTLTGTVRSAAGISSIIIEDMQENGLLCKVGDTTTPDTVIYKASDKTMKAGINGLIIGINKNVVSIIDYDSMHIVVNYPAKYIEMLRSFESVTAEVNGEKKQLELLGIDATVDYNGEFSVEYLCPFRLVQGEKVSVKVVVSTISDAVVIPKGFVQKDYAGKTYIACGETAETTKNIYVTVGVESGENTQLLDAEELVGKKIFVPADRNRE